MFSPIVTKWYAYLSKNVKYPYATAFGKIPSKTQKAVLDTAAQTAADQLLFAPVGIGMYFVGIGVLQGQNWQEIKSQLTAKYVPTLLNNWKVWPAFQMVNFYFVPPSGRVLGQALMSIAWNTYLSAENYAEKDVQVPDLAA